MSRSQGDLSETKYVLERMQAACRLPLAAHYDITPFTPRLWDEVNLQLHLQNISAHQPPSSCNHTQRTASPFFTPALRSSFHPDSVVTVALAQKDTSTTILAPIKHQANNLEHNQPQWQPASNVSARSFVVLARPCAKHAPA